MGIKTSVIGIKDHSLLSGLSGDDHTQYQKESEKGAASGYASLDAGGDVPVGELDNIGTLIANDDLKQSADTERTEASLTYVKKKEITLGFGGTIRIKFDLASGTNAITGYGRIYRNGAAVGTERTENTSVYQTFTEDISGCSAGDLIQIYSKTANVTYPAKVRNFRIYYTFDEVTLD